MAQNPEVFDPKYIALGKQASRTNGAVTVGAPTKAYADIPQSADAKVSDDRYFVGHIDQSGLTRTEGKETNPKRNWEGVQYFLVSNSETVQLRLRLESYRNAVVQTLLHGLGVRVSDDGKTMTTAVGGNTAPRVSWDFRLAGSDGVSGMLFAPDAQVSTTSDIQYTAEDTVSVEVTLELFADEDGKYLYESFTIQDEDGKWVLPEFKAVEPEEATPSGDSAPDTEAEDVAA